MKRRKGEMAKKFAEELQIPQTAVTDSFIIEFRGANDVTVDGCKGLVEYGDTAVALNLGSTVVRFIGADLEIVNFFEEQAIIKGTLAAMEFSS